jgi:hypothetical protein
MGGWIDECVDEQMDGMCGTNIRIYKHTHTHTHTYGLNIIRSMHPKCSQSNRGKWHKSQKIQNIQNQSNT